MRVVRVAFVGLICAAFATPALAQRDHFMCYAVKQSKGFNAFGKTDATKKLYAAIDDVLDGSNPQGLDPASVPAASGTYQMKKIKDVCIVADKNGEGVSNPGTLLTTYQLSPQKGQCVGDPAVPCKSDADCGANAPCLAIPKFDKKDPRNQSVRVADQLVDLRVDFGKEVMAFVPATGSPSSFQGVPAGEEHYKCYSIKPTKASCVGGVNAGGACKDSSACPGGSCVANPKFPKETHPSGLAVSFMDGFTGIFDPTDPEKPMALSKLRMFCQAADKKLVSNPLEVRNEQQAGMLCYSGKTAKLACDGGTNNNAPCKKDVDCPGGSCRIEGLFDKKNAAMLGNFVEDQLFQHRLDVAKEGLFCVPACRGVTGDELNDLTSHISQLALGPDGAHAALAGLPRGVNVDSDLGTFTPFDQDPTGGIDNQLQGIGGILNSVLQETLDDGGFGLLFQASALANGPINIKGFTGDLAPTPGCPVGTPPAALDPGNPATPCNYLADSSGFPLDYLGSCRKDPVISLDVNVSGYTPAPGTASVTGGGPGNDFTLSIPFGNNSFDITATNVIVNATATHNGTSISEIKGVLGGAVNHADLVATVAALPNACVGGVNDGDQCSNLGDCPGGTSCELLAGYTAAALSNFLAFGFPPDLDLDPVVDGMFGPHESISLGLLFRATKANVLGFD